MTDTKTMCVTTALLCVLLVPGVILGDGRITEPDVERSVPNARGLKAVFTEGQFVTAPVPSEPVGRWRVLDDDGNEVGSGELEASATEIKIGRLGIG